MSRFTSPFLMAAFCCTASLTFAADPMNDWRRTALENMHVAAASRLISKPAEIDAYVAAGFNTLVTFDVNGFNQSGTAWSFKSEDEVRAETAFAREKGLPLVVGMAVEPFVSALSKTGGYSLAATTSGVVANGLIPQATDSEIRERLELWKKYGDDVVVGVFPWYDDVFWQRVDVTRQRHVYRLIKRVVADWYVFGMIGDFGFSASNLEVALFYDPAAFDHLIVLMYPFNVGSRVTGFPMDNVASSDPDGDMVRYVDHYLARMEQRFFRRLKLGQLVLLVGQAFYYAGEAEGQIPRASDVAIMMLRGGEQLRKMAGQKQNHSTGYYYWGGDGSAMVGLSQRSDWLAAVRNVHGGEDRKRPAQRSSQP